MGLATLDAKIVTSTASVTNPDTSRQDELEKSSESAFSSISSNAMLLFPESSMLPRLLSVLCKAKTTYAIEKRQPTQQACYVSRSTLFFQIPQ
jgi:hypothetical protein